MWNSRMLIDVGGDASVETSLLEASNLVVLKVNTYYFVEFTGIGYIDVEFTLPTCFIYAKSFYEKCLFM